MSSFLKMNLNLEILEFSQNWMIHFSISKYQSTLQDILSFPIIPLNQNLLREPMRFTEINTIECCISSNSNFWVIKKSVWFQRFSNSKLWSPARAATAFNLWSIAPGQITLLMSITSTVSKDQSEDTIIDTFKVSHITLLHPKFTCGHCLHIFLHFLQIHAGLLLQSWLMYWHILGVQVSKNPSPSL